MMETKLSLAWRRAAQELGVRLIAPFELRADDGKPLSCTGLLLDFGGEKGTVIIGDQDPDEAVDVAHEQDYYVTMMSDSSYGEYDPERFAATLSDWEWYGSPDQVPPWFRGRVTGR